MPLRRESAEKVAGGRKLDDAGARAIAAAAFEGATPMTQNAYKVPMGIALLTRALLAAGGVS